MADKSYKFWDRMAKRYSSQPLENEQAYFEKLRVIREHLDHRAEILEIGCGSGSTAILLAPHTRRYLATDYASRMLEIAAAKAESMEVDNLEFQCCAVSDLAIDDDSLDVVISLNVLHLLKDWQEAITRAFTMLKPGGVLFSSTACIADMNSRVRHIAPLGGLMGLLPVLSVFTRDEFVENLTAAGFKVFHEWQPEANKAIFIAAVKPPQR